MGIVMPRFYKPKLQENTLHDRNKAHLFQTFCGIIDVLMIRGIISIVRKMNAYYLSTDIYLSGVTRYILLLELSIVIRFFYINIMAYIYICIQWISINVDIYECYFTVFGTFPCHRALPFHWQLLRFLSILFVESLASSYKTTSL